MEKQKTNDVIQYMRAIAILLVVLQHAVIALIPGNVAILISSICFSIDVNVFMFISGYLYEQNYCRYRSMGIGHFMGKKAAALVVPYLFWECLLYFGAWSVYNGPSVLNRFIPIMQKLGFTQLSITDIIASLLTFNNSYVELYWFLYALFVVFIIQHIFGSLFKARKGILLLLVLLPLCLLIGQKAYIIKKIVVGMLMFSAGRYFKATDKRFSEIRIARCVIAIIVFCVVFKSPDVKNIPYIEQLWYIAKSTVLGLSGTIVVIWIAQLSEKFLMIRKAAYVVGNYSLSIYLLHNPWVIKAVSMLIPSGGGYAALLPCVILGVLIPIGMDHFIIAKSSFLSLVMLGRRNKR